MSRPRLRAFAAMIALLAAGPSSARDPALPHRVAALALAESGKRSAASAAAEPTQADPHEARIARCSLAFLHCAGTGRKNMDVCIVGIPSCAGETSASCCPPACTRRYAALRRAGHTQPEAVRAALFPEPGKTCAELP